MTNLERLKLELNKKQYYTDEEYTMFLDENNLVGIKTYDKKENEQRLIQTVIAILETLSNDTDLMRKIDSKDIMSVSDATKWIFERIDRYKNTLSELQFKESGNNVVRPFFLGRKLR